MNQLLKGTLKWHESVADAFVEKHGGDESAMLAELMNNTHSMSEEARRKVVTYNYAHSPVAAAWAEKHSVKFLAELSELEWKLVMEKNPFYLMFAFQLKYDAMIDFIKVNGLCVPDALHAHAIVMAALRQKPSVTVKEVADMCRQRGIGVVPANIEEVVPFDADTMSGHPFENVNLGSTTPGALGSLVKHKGMLMGCIREKQNTINHVEFHSATMSYRLRSNNVACFQLLAKYIGKAYVHV